MRNGTYRVQAQAVSAKLRREGWNPCRNGRRVNAQGVIVQQQGDETRITVRYDGTPAKELLVFKVLRNTLNAMVIGGKPWKITRSGNAHVLYISHIRGRS